MTKSKSAKVEIKNYNYPIIGLVVAAFAVLGVLLLTNSKAAAPYQSIFPDSPFNHCQTYATNTKVCWNNVGDVINLNSFYKKTAKSPNGKLTCWAVLNPPAHYPDFGLDYQTANQVMATAPVYLKTFSPMPPSSTVFTAQTTGATAQWCRTDLYDGSVLLGTGQFGLGAPGQSSEY